MDARRNRRAQAVAVQAKQPSKEARDKRVSHAETAGLAQNHSKTFTMWHTQS